MPYCTTSSHKINFPFPCPSDFFHIVPSSHLEKKQKIFAKSVFPCNLLAFSPKREHPKSNRNVAQPGLARLTGGQKVESSNLSIPTIFLQSSAVGLHSALFFFASNPPASQTCVTKQALPLSAGGFNQRDANRLRRIPSDGVSPFSVSAVLSTIAVQQRGGRAEIATAFSRKDALHIRRERCKKSSPPQNALNLALNYTE